MLDTHDHPIPADVWRLYERAVERFGPVSTLIERDANVPALPVLMEEMRAAQAILDGPLARAIVA